MEKENVTAKQNTITSAGSIDDFRRRSSILKHRSPLTPAVVDDEPADTTLAKQARRVSFASSNFVKQFTADPEKVTIWDTTYEEAVSHAVDSSSQSSNKDTQSSMELTLCQQRRRESRRGTIYFDQGEDIEIDEEIFENLPPELAVDKENLMIRKRKSEQVVEGDVLKEKRANVSDMEFTQVITKREEVVRRVVMYRNIEEITMMDSVRGDLEEMEFTECVPVQRIMANNTVERADVTGVSVEETACIGHIVQATEFNKRDETTGNHINGEVKRGAEAAVNFEESSHVDKVIEFSRVENTVPENTSMRLDFTTCMNEDTQLLLLNCDLSSNNNSKIRPHSEYSKIMMARDYNPSPANSKIMALCDSSSEHHVTINNDDSVNVDVTELSKKDVDRLNIMQESFLNASPMNGSGCSDIDVPEVERDYCKEAMAQLIDVKMRKSELEAKDINAWSLRMHGYNENIKKYMNVIKNQLLKKREELKMYSFDLETSSLHSTTTEEEMETGDNSVFNSTQEQEEELSIMEKIQQKAKQSKHYWQINIENEGKCVVTTLYGAVKSILTFDPTNGKVENIITSVRIKADAEPIARYVMNNFERKLSPELLVSSLGQHYDILSFLDYVQMTFLHFVKVFDEHYELVKEYGFEMHADRRVTLTLISKELKLVWDVEVNFANEVLSEDSVKVRARLGTVNERAVKKCINGCPQGFAAFAPFALNVKNYMNSLKRPLRN